MKTLGSLMLLVALLLTSCSSTTSICPTYPKPSPHILERIKSLHDAQVDEWMIRQYKLNLLLRF